MRCAMAQPCMGSSATIFRMSRSSVPCTRSVGLLMALASVTDNSMPENAAVRKRIYGLRALTSVVGFRTQASPVMFMSDWWSMIPMDPGEHRVADSRRHARRNGDLDSVLLEEIDQRRQGAVTAETRTVIFWLAGREAVDGPAARAGCEIPRGNSDFDGPDVCDGGVQRRCVGPVDGMERAVEIGDAVDLKAMRLHELAKV